MNLYFLSLNIYALTNTIFSYKKDFVISIFFNKFFTQLKKI